MKKERRKQISLLFFFLLIDSSNVFFVLFFSFLLLLLRDTFSLHCILSLCIITSSLCPSSSFLICVSLGSMNNASISPWSSFPHSAPFILSLLFLPFSLSIHRLLFFLSVSLRICLFSLQSFLTDLLILQHCKSFLGFFKSLDTNNNQWSSSSLTRQLRSLSLHYSRFFKIQFTG